MGARSDLNGAHLVGCLIPALALGAVFESLALGLATFLGLAAVAFANGKLRPAIGKRTR